MIILAKLSKQRNKLQFTTHNAIMRLIIYSLETMKMNSFTYKHIYNLIISSHGEDVFT